MTRVLVTGAAGFVGRYLVAHLAESGRDVVGTIYGDELGGDMNCKLLSCDVADASQVGSLFERVRPDEVYHLAAITFVPEAAQNPQKLLAINLGGTLNVLEAALNLGGACKVLAVCSGEEYGVVDPALRSIDEQTPLEPGNLYAVSKLAADLMARQYHEHKGAHVVRVRPFNHTGPGQDPRFVCSDFARQIAQMETGEREPVLHVGNVEAERDFCDVRDVVRAYRLLVENGASGDVYNVCSGVGHRISDIIEILIGMSRTAIRVVQDPDRMRPSEVPRMVGDNRKIQKAVNWETTIEFKRTLSDILNHWRDTLRERPECPTTT